MSDGIRKSYYSITPANVRYDDELNANAKLLYGEITALCNEKGYCWANNSYFAELYGVAKETVSRWISKLENQGYIRTSLVYEKGTRQVKERRIYISDPIDENVNTPRRNNQYPIDEIINTPIDEIIKDNTTVINNTSNNIYSSFFEECWKLYPNKRGKGKVSNTAKKRIHKLGDEFKRCIERYIADVEEQRGKGFKELKYKNGSTFFNNGYIDYLDKNYKEAISEFGTNSTADIGEHREKSLNELIQEELDRQGRTEL